MCWIWGPLCPIFLKGQVFPLARRSPMRNFLIIVTLLLLSVKSYAAEHPKPKEDHLQVRLISPLAATGDKTVIPVAMEVKLQPNWDTYWRTPGDAGLAPALDWKGSDNFKSADMKFPVPKR